jgi:glyoxylase-like metal-dependent hydrolase (beta-lactamase superfamily II)
VLIQVTEGVLIHQSDFLQTNAVVVQGRAGVLLIDPGVRGDEMTCLANDLRGLGQPVVAGFSTHPHWDHLLWQASLGTAPRYGTARCAATVRDRLSDAGAKARVAGMIPPDIVEQVPLDLLGLITGLPADAAWIPWDGPQVRIIEHQAHAPGHAALLIEERGVLIAADMLSDVLIPLLDLNGTADPIEDHLAALRLLEGAVGDVDVVVPVTDPSAELIRYAHGSTRTGGICRPCVTPMFSATRGSAHRPRSEIGCPACTNGTSSTSPDAEPATGRLDEDPLASRVVATVALRPDCTLQRRSAVGEARAHPLVRQGGGRSRRRDTAAESTGAPTRRRSVGRESEERDPPTGPARRRLPAHGTRTTDPTPSYPRGSGR